MKLWYKLIYRQFELHNFSFFIFLGLATAHNLSEHGYGQQKIGVCFALGLVPAKVEAVSPMVKEVGYYPTNTP